MRYLHTMVRVFDLEKALHFYCDLLGLVVVREKRVEAGRFTLVFLATDANPELPMVELTWNWDEEKPYSGGRNFGHLAYAVENIYETCERLQNGGVAILRPPRDGRMAFVRSPDGISIELLQDGPALPEKEPWVSMASRGEW